jgi:simple sugar transport system ATP-binding protein
VSATSVPQGEAPPRLEAHGVEKRFADLVALAGVDLTVRPGEIHALLGENGAGKSTLGNVIAGIYKPDGGTLHVDGAPVQLHSPRDAIRAGIGMVHQHFRLVDALTVAENLHMGWEATPAWASRRWLRRHTEELCERFGFALAPDRPAWQLAVGERQQLEILRVLARGARMLILDEPTAVLTPQETEELFRAMRDLRAQGQSIVFISHKLNEVLAIADLVTVLRGGAWVATQPAADTDANALAHLMTGERDVVQASRIESPSERVALRLEGVSAAGSHGLRALSDVELTVHEREIVGVAGVSGNGQRELAEVATGMLKPAQGRVAIGEQDLTGCGPREYAAAGAGHIPQDRLKSGVAKARSVLENAVLRDYRRAPLSNRGLLNGGASERFATELVERADVRGVSSVERPFSYLSGGNQQKLVAHREAAIASKLLVAALPTRGLDVAAAGALRNLLLEKRNGGTGVLLISEELDELLMLSDRVVVMYDGRIVGEFASDKADVREIGLLMGSGVAGVAQEASA